jgi:putative inorganic carbon (HCO3(-)) transporter
VLLFWLMAYITAIYLRPAEIVASWSDVRVVAIVMTITGIVALASLLLKPRTILDHPLDKAVLGFAISIVVSNVAWGWLWGGYNGLLSFLPTLLGYLFIRVGVNQPRHLKWTVALLVVLNVVQAINGVVEFRTGTGLGGVTPVQGTRVRGTGIFNDPNDLGMTLVMALPFAVMLLTAKTRAIWRLAAAAAIVVMLLAIEYTQSRGAVLGVVAVAMVYAGGRIGRVPAMMLAAVVFAGFTMLGPSRAGDLDAGEESAQSRIQAWSAGIEMFKQRPVFGVGFGRFTDFHERVAHNSFVHSFAELGIVGEFCFVGFFYWFFRSLTALKKRVPPEQGRWATALQASGVGLVMCIWFLSRAYVITPYMLLAIGSSYATMSMPKDERLAWRLIDVVAVATLAIAVVVITYGAVRLLAVWS